ncbi:MAG: HAMP domain-containing protein [Candidatus Rokubacteria bacterium]|nr:HAMP domain-containing protein [Candidatus Rokubacteria bacterium]
MTVRLGVRHKLVLLTLVLLVVVSFSFTWLNLTLSRGWVEEDLKDRAITFAREVAATIGDRREFESGALLQDQIQQIMAVRQNVLQLDIVAFGVAGARVIATSRAQIRLPFHRKDADQVLKGQVISRLVKEERGRYWEVMAPITLEGTIAGAVAAKFSLDRADRLASRIRSWAFGLAAASVLVTGILMSLAVSLVVDRPIRRFMGAIARVRRGDTEATVPLRTADEFGVLAIHFNEMMMRINHFNDELQGRVKEATAELDRRYQEVQRLNELLFEMQRNLSHAERLALSGRIMAEVAHEIGTPLHSVAGHLELLRKDLPSDLRSENLVRRLLVIETQLARVTEIIAQLLDLTRRSPGEPGPVDVNQLVRDTADLVRPGLTAAGLTLQVILDSELPTVQGHSNGLQQVVLNLLTNAIDATPAGGRVRVTTRARPDRGEVELEISDTGQGIPLAHQKQIFEPFFSTKERGQGTGLGLFISAQIVREHRGRIEVQSAEGCGSTLRVFLPVLGGFP